VFKDLNDVLPEWVEPFMFIDDLCVLATSELEALGIASSLERYFSEHPAGPYALKRLEVADVAEGFDFLGYDFRGTVFNVEVDISWRSRGRLVDWALEELSGEFKASAHCPSEEFVAGLRRRLGGYSASLDTEAYARQLLSELERAFATAVQADLHDPRPWSGVNCLRREVSNLKSIRTTEIDDEALERFRS
jgi:hypothetical protein